MVDNRWMKSFLTDFINLYREQTCLWKVSSKDYNNKVMRNKAYDKLVALSRTVFPEADKIFVARKIQNLRSAFRKEYKKAIDSRRNAVSEEEVYVPSLWYYDLLLFTQDQDSTGNYNNEEDEYSNKDFEDNAEDTNAAESEVPFSMFAAKQEMFVQEHEQMADERDFTENSITPPPHARVFRDNEVKPKKAKYTMSETEFMKAVSTSRPTAAINTNVNVEEFEAVGINVSKKLQRMDPVQAIYAESIINSALRRGLLGTLTETMAICDQKYGNHQ